ncbi:MAG: DUF4349 domain-containing protein [Myxococcales bacterium]|nr:DUF4349 domain-containing protein [Myxococcales bacterium]MBL0197522.1 DUF4349 domain-containing protein [Myxococcales bacterium]HQY61415.1 DUF4349 domain-containing protein [Polyangiaceae bacterium]
MHSAPLLPACRRLLASAAALLLLTSTAACGAQSKAPAAYAPAMPHGGAPAAAAGESASASVETSARSASPSPAPSPASPSAGTTHGGSPGRAAATPPAGPAAQANAKAASEARAPLVVYTGALSMLTDPDKIPETIDKVIDVAESHGGSLMGRRDDGVEIRVPSLHFRSALKELEGVASVTARSVSAEDVTEQVHDLEVRLSNLKATQRRLQEFLARAANVNDALTVERELERVAREIDTIEGKVTFLKTRASFSRITVALRERPKPSPIVKEPPPPPPPPPPKAATPNLPVPWLQGLGVDPLLALTKN